MKRRSGYLLSFALCILMLLSLMPARIARAGESDKLQKTAEELDENDESKVTLSFPGKQDALASDIVFVLDKSGASAQEDIYAQARKFLENIKSTAQEKGLNIKVGVVLFNRIGNVKQPLTDVVTGYTAIVDAMNSRVSMGTNMHAGLLAAQKMLDDDTEVLPSNKHVVLISDGATYLYSKGGDYTSAYTRSFGNPANQTNPNTGRPFTNSSDKKGGIWEWQSREYNLPNNFKTFGDGSNFVFSQAMTSPAKLGELLTYYYKNDQDPAKNWSQYEYVYDFSSAYLGMGRKMTPINHEAPANIEVAMWSADQTFQNMYSKGYDMNVYFKNAADFDGSNFLKYLARHSNNGELNTDFSELQKNLLDKIAADSYVEDVIGQAFDFVNEADKISLRVGTEQLAVEKISDNQYGFGKKADGTYRFTLSYQPGVSEKFVFHFGEAIYPQAPVTLSYHVKLVSTPVTPGVHELQTNESAVLHPVDGNGVAGQEMIFPVPAVKKVINKVTFVNDAATHAVVSVEENKAINMDRLTSQSMPADPVKEGFVFKEWNTKKDGTGIAFTGDTVVREDITVYAIYRANTVTDNKTVAKGLDGASDTKKPAVTRSVKSGAVKTSDLAGIPLYAGLSGAAGICVLFLAVRKKKSVKK